MTETPHETDAAPAARSSRRKAGLEGMLLPELKQVAAGLGIRTTGLRKGQLVEAIKGAQVSSAPRTGDSSGGASSGEASSGGAGDGGSSSGGAGDGGSRDAARKAPRSEPAPTPEASAPSDTAPDGSSAGGSSADSSQRGRRDDQQDARQDGRQDARSGGTKDQQEDRPQGKQRDDQDQGKQRDDQQQGKQRDDQQQDKQQDRQDKQQGRQQDQQEDDDEQGGSRRNRRRRGRDRTQNDTRPGDNRQHDGRQNDGRQNDGRQNDNRQHDRGNDNRQNERQHDRQNDRQHDRQNDRGRRGEPDLQILEDDVLAPCAGILDLLDNYAFVRTSGYLPGPDDVYVSMSMVRKHGLRRGDAVAGQVRQPREGERREKFNPLVRIDSVNGADPEAARNRVDFGKLTPVNPSERLRLETGPGDLVGRALDLVTPVGKGQRGLVLSPAKAGKTTVLQAMAASVTSNNPECHVMVVLVDERPEEVTDYTRSIKGEVISSTFDRPPSDHTLVAELALERAKRLVELGHDVVMLLDGLTRLARAYNLAAASGGRGSAGVLDAAAVHQPKKFFGAARNIENGGSLTVVATASVGGSSPTDAAILEELEGTENMELRLCRPAPGTEVFPVFDVLSSGTRREELLLSEGELTAVRQLRRSLDTLQRDAAAQRLVEQLKGSSTNLELLRSPRR